MGTDHTEFNNAAWTRSLGLADGALSHIEGQNYSRSSKPATDDNETLKSNMDAIEADEKDKKELLKKKKEAKDAQKPFEYTATMAKMLPELQQWGAKLAARVEEISDKAFKTLTEIQNEDGEFQKMFDAMTVLLKGRLDSLDAAFYRIGTNTLDRDHRREPAEDHKDEHDKQFKEYMESSKVQNTLFNSRNLKPFANANELITMSGIYWHLLNPQLSCKDDVKKEKARIREMLKVFSSLLGRTSEATSRLMHAMKKQQQKTKTAAEKLEKEKEAAHKTDMVRQAAHNIITATAAKTLRKQRTFKIFETPHTFQEISVMPLERASKMELSP